MNKIYKLFFLILLTFLVDSRMVFSQIAFEKKYRQNFKINIIKPIELNGGYMLIGYAMDTVISDYGPEMLQVDKFGDLQFNKLNSIGYVTKACKTLDGALALAGSRNFDPYASPVESEFILKTDTSGNTIWYYNFLGDLFNTQICPTIDSGIVLLGCKLGTLNYNYINLCKFDVFGNKLWSKTYFDTSKGFFPLDIKQTFDSGF